MAHDCTLRLVGGGSSLAHLLPGEGRRGVKAGPTPLSVPATEREGRRSSEGQPSAVSQPDRGGMSPQPCGLCGPISGKLNFPPSSSTFAPEKLAPAFVNDCRVVAPPVTPPEPRKS